MYMLFDRNILDQTKNSYVTEEKLVFVLNILYLSSSSWPGMLVLVLKIKI